MFIPDKIKIPREDEYACPCSKDIYRHDVFTKNYWKCILSIIVFFFSSIYILKLIHVRNKRAAF